VAAATLTKCLSGNFMTAAFASAYTNGFDNNGITNSMIVFNPPAIRPISYWVCYYHTSWLLVGGRVAQRNHKFSFDQCADRILNSW